MRGIELHNGGALNLFGSSVHAFVDDETGWPERSKLTLDGFTYDYLSTPLGVDARLRWLQLQDGFHPQPYRQLAKCLRESGDESGAKRVLIAEDDLRYSELGPVGRLWGRFLKYTIGYGHRPMLTIMWSTFVLLCGWGIVRMAKTAGEMRPTYPENTPASGDKRYERLYPLLYSLDVFLPFVNLHQENYWWPDADASGQSRALGLSMTCHGSLVLYYLWAQIVAGWILSAIFVAGVTGLIRSD